MVGTRKCQLTGTVRADTLSSVMTVRWAFQGRKKWKCTGRDHSCARGGGRWTAGRFIVGVLLNTRTSIGVWASLAYHVCELSPAVAGVR